jgi:hypothetical protein
MRRTLIASFCLFAASVLPSAASAQVRAATFKDPDVALDFYGWVQPRFTYQQQDTRPEINFKPNPAFTVLRARLGAIGTLGSWGKAQVEIDMSRETVTPIDAFMVFTPYKSRKFAIDLNVGLFRVPISRQNIIQSRNTQLPDLAYFVTPRFIIDRDIGVMSTLDFFEGRVKLFTGIYNGNEPGRGQVLNADPYFLYAGRLQIEPLGAAPRFEGDLRPVAERKKPLLTIAGSAIRNPPSRAAPSATAPRTSTTCAATSAPTWASGGRAPRSTASFTTTSTSPSRRRGPTRSPSFGSSAGTCRPATSSPRPGCASTSRWPGASSTSTPTSA